MIVNHMPIDNATVAVTGGAGFLGSHVCKRFARMGSDVHVLDNFHAGDQSLVPDGATTHEVDIRSGAFPVRLHEIDPDVVVHLAALHYIPYCNDNPEATFDVNVMGTRALLEAAQGCNPEKVVFASSAAVYPPREGPNHEDSELGPMDIYGRTKVVGEDYMEAWARDTGISTTAARLFNIYGPNETNPHLVPAILDQVEAGERTIELGNLTPKRDFIHVSDVARAITTMVTDADTEYEVYNVGSGDSKSVKEVVDIVAEALGEDIEIAQDEDRVRESDRPDLEADITKIERDLGWSPEVEFVEGVATLLEE